LNFLGDVFFAQNLYLWWILLFLFLYFFIVYHLDLFFFIVFFRQR
jgi:hypothetical protein